MSDIHSRMVGEHRWRRARKESNLRVGYGPEWWKSEEYLKSLGNPQEFAYYVPKCQPLLDFADSKEKTENRPKLVKKIK